MINWNLTLPTVVGFVHAMLVVIGGANLAESQFLRLNIESVLSDWGFLSRHRPSVVALSLLSRMFEIGGSMDWMKMSKALQRVFRVGKMWKEGDSLTLRVDSKLPKGF